MWRLQQTSDRRCLAAKGSVNILLLGNHPAAEGLFSDWAWASWLWAGFCALGTWSANWSSVIMYTEFHRVLDQDKTQNQDSSVPVKTRSKSLQWKVWFYLKLSFVISMINKILEPPVLLNFLYSDQTLRECFNDIIYKTHEILVLVLVFLKFYLWNKQLKCEIHVFTCEICHNMSPSHAAPIRNGCFIHTFILPELLLFHQLH